MTAWSAWRCAARRGVWDLATGGRPIAKIYAAGWRHRRPPLAKNIARLSRFLLSTVLQALGKAGWEQLFPEDVLLAAEGVNQLAG
jgi:hypothetical protein